MTQEPLSIKWNNLGKRFSNRWILKKMFGEIPAKTHSVIKGANGSGKSTFGKLLVAASDASQGELTWFAGNKKLEIDEIPQRISWSAPFMELPDEMTIEEMFTFHTTFRSTWDNISLNQKAIDAGLQSHLHSTINTLSSGQKQRVKLILALGTEAGLILLDEPCSNLDEEGMRWYHAQLTTLTDRTTVVVCSNNRPEEHLDDALEIIIK